MPQGCPTNWKTKFHGTGHIQSRNGCQAPGLFRENPLNFPSISFDKKDIKKGVKRLNRDHDLNCTNKVRSNFVHRVAMLSRVAISDMERGPSEKPSRPNSPTHKEQNYDTSSLYLQETYLPERSFRAGCLTISRKEDSLSNYKSSRKKWAGYYPKKKNHAFQCPLSNISNFLVICFS